MNSIVIFSQLTGQMIFNHWDIAMENGGRKRIILDRDNKNPYLVRYYLLFKNRGDDSRFNLFLHKFIQGDTDEHLHDHPWGFMNFIIQGGYNETVFTYDEHKKITGKETIWRGRGYMAQQPATFCHRLTLDSEKPTCWTLFVPLKRNRPWGFWKQKKDDYEWVESESYFSEKAQR